MTTRHVTTLLLTFAMLFAATPTVWAGPQTKDELKARFKQRDPDLSRLKQQGKVGETWEGYVDAVEEKFLDDKKVKDLVEAENADRKKLYKLIADDVPKEGEKKLTVTQVAERAARKNFREAKADHFLKTKEGVWFQRKQVQQLEKAAKIGETWEGMVEAVDPKDANDSQIKTVVAAENRIRRDEYQKRAEDRGTSPTQEARKAGEQAQKNAKPGEYFKTKDGEWTKK